MAYKITTFWSKRTDRIIEVQEDRHDYTGPEDRWDIEEKIETAEVERKTFDLASAV
jgi:hypothetical protein